jgi:uncharacterized protein DUF2442
MGILALAADERVAHVEVSNDELRVRMKDGRTISVPLAWYPRLLNATNHQRNNWQIIGAGYGIHWPDLDEDLSIEGLLRGAPAPPHRNMGIKSSAINTKNEDDPVAKANDEKGIWDYLAEAEEASPKLVQLLQSLNTDTDLLTAKIEGHAEKIQKITLSGSSASHRRYRAVAYQCATDINRFSGRVEELLPGMKKETSALESSFSWISEYIVATPTERDEVIAALIPPLDNFLSSFKTAQKSITHFREQALELRQKNLSAELNKATNRLVTVLDGLLEAFEEIESFGLRVKYQVVEKFGPARNDQTEPEGTDTE